MGTTKTGILMGDFAAETILYLTIICSRISFLSNMKNVPTMYAEIVACLLDNILLNDGQFVLLEMRHYRNKGGPMIFYFHN